MPQMKNVSRAKLLVGLKMCFPVCRRRKRDLCDCRSTAEDQQQTALLVNI